MIIVKKLDKRNTGSGEWAYYITIHAGHTQHPINKDLVWYLVRNQYQEIREWCWQTWGSSKELNEWLRSNFHLMTNGENSPCQNAHWCWITDQSYSRIYFRTDKEIMLFKLRWL